MSHRLAVSFKDNQGLPEMSQSASNFRGQQRSQQHQYRQPFEQEQSLQHLHNSDALAQSYLSQNPRRVERVNSSGSLLLSKQNPAQPFGSGEYSNQLALRTSQMKKAVTSFGSSVISQKYSQRTRGFSSQGFRSQSTMSGSAVNNFSASLQTQQEQEKLRQKLYLDERTKTVPKSTVKNLIIEKILSDGEVVVANKELMHSINELKRLHLLKQNESHVHRYSGVGKFPYVFNDYHMKSTNNGFSRQEKGGYFFTK